MMENYSTILSNIENFLREYIQTFHVDDRDVKYHFELKQKHILRVKDLMCKLSKKLDLSVNIQKLCEIIGILHDIGRFRQYYEFNTFNDQISLDHALLGIEIIEENNLLKNCSHETKNIIYDAIIYHNAAVLPKIFNKKTIFYIKLLRDADKLDIFHFLTKIYENMELGIKPKFHFGNIEENEYDKGLLSDFLEGRQIFYKNTASLIDFKIIKLAWIYDVNFPITYQILYEKQYLERIILTINNTHLQSLLQTHINKFFGNLFRTRTPNHSFHPIDLKYQPIEFNLSV